MALPMSQAQPEDDYEVIALPQTLIDEYLADLESIGGANARAEGLQALAAYKAKKLPSDAVKKLRDGIRQIKRWTKENIPRPVRGFGNCMAECLSILVPGGSYFAYAICILICFILKVVFEEEEKKRKR